MDPIAREARTARKARRFPMGPKGPIAREASMAREARAAEPRAACAGDEIRNEQIGKLYNTDRHSAFFSGFVGA